MQQPPQHITVDVNSLKPIRAYEYNNNDRWDEKFLNTSINQSAGNTFNMNILIYGHHSKELSEHLTNQLDSKRGHVDHCNVGSHLRHTGIAMFNGALIKYNPNLVIVSYVTKQEMSHPEMYECLDTLLSLCWERSVIPIFFFPLYVADKEVYSSYVSQVKSYCLSHGICLIDSNQINFNNINSNQFSLQNKYTSEEYKSMARYIHQEITQYCELGLPEKINYDTPLKQITKTLEIDLSVETQFLIKGKGHIDGFVVDIENQINFDQYFSSKERKNVTLKKGNKFMTGGVNSGEFVTKLLDSSAGKFVIKSILYKGTINNVIIDGIDTGINSLVDIDTTNTFLSHSHPIVHSASVNRKKVKEWATSALDKCENCVPFAKSAKNVIVIFSSTDRNYLTEYKKQYMAELAHSWNADLHIITNPLDVLTDKQREQALSFKSRRNNILNYVCKIVVVYNLLAEYDKVMWSDDTNVFSPFAPNLFNFVPENKLGALVIPRDCGFTDAVHDYKYILKHRGIAIKDVYYNTGLMIIPKIYRDIFSFESVLKDHDLFQSPYPTQCWQNYLMDVHNCEVFDISCMYNLMPCSYHYEPKYNEITDISHLYEELLKYHVVHFTGFHKHREMLHQNFVEHSKLVFDQKITIVIMNFKRSDNIKDYILPYYDNIHAVDQVILVHCLEDTVFEYQSDKVQHVYEWDTDKDYGVFTRYIAAKKYAKNKCVIFTDDDVIIPAKTLSMVYQKWKQDPNRVIGAEGRRIYLNVSTNLYEYKAAAYHGDVDFLLTSCCMTSYDNIVYTCSKEPVMGDYKNTTVIKWNGEDMYLCLTCSILHNTKCYSVDSPLISLDDGEHIISKVSSHVEERCRFLNLFFTHYQPVSSFAPILIELAAT